MVNNNPHIGAPEPAAEKPEAKASKASKESLESAVASLRMEISRLADMIGLLSNSIIDMKRGK